MRPSTIILFAALLGSCGASQQAILMPLAGVKHGAPELEGLRPGDWVLKQGRLFKAVHDDGTILVANSAAGSGLSFVPSRAPHPAAFAVRASARLEKEGLDGGWGVEFGLGEGQGTYRALLYASGRFCLDKDSDGQPHFIHCVNRLPWVKTGEADNEILVSAVGSHLEVWVNGRRVVEFEDPQYRSGRLALAVAGAGARVRFLEFSLWRLKGGSR